MLSVHGITHHVRGSVIPARVRYHFCAYHFDMSQENSHMTAFILHVVEYNELNSKLKAEKPFKVDNRENRNDYRTVA